MFIKLIILWTSESLLKSSIQRKRSLDTPCDGHRATRARSEQLNVLRRNAVHIEKAIDIIRPRLEVMEGQAPARKIVVESEEPAHQYQFATSPTVRRLW